jgi:hypothetical protein
MSLQIQYTLSYDSVLLRSKHFLVRKEKLLKTNGAYTIHTVYFPVDDWFQYRIFTFLFTSRSVQN